MIKEQQNMNMPWTLGPRVCQWWRLRLFDRWSMGSPHNRITAHRCHIHTDTATWPYSDRRRGRGLYPNPQTKRRFMFTHTHTHTKKHVTLKHTRSSSPLTDGCEHSLIHTDTRQHIRYRGSTAPIQWYFSCKLLIKQSNLQAVIVSSTYVLVNNLVKAESSCHKLKQI